MCRPGQTDGRRYVLDLSNKVLFVMCRPDQTDGRHYVLDLSNKYCLSCVDRVRLMGGVMFLTCSISIVCHVSTGSD